MFSGGFQRPNFLGEKERGEGVGMGRCWFFPRKVLNLIPKKVNIRVGIYWKSLSLLTLPLMNSDFPVEFRWRSSDPSLMY